MTCGLLRCAAALAAFMVLAAMYAAAVPSARAEEGKGAEAMIENMEWLGHDTFKIEAGGKVIYTDPFKLPDGLPKADLVLVTHAHYDHCSPEDLAKITSPDTVIVSPSDCDGSLNKGVRLVKPGDSISEMGVEIQAVRAYNTNKKFHPKDNAWVGYVFTVEGTRIYIAGDTDYIPEMKNIRCDIALLPVSGTYVMTAEEAVEAANDIKPGIAVPMHYGSIVGEESDARRFAELYKGKTHIFTQR